MTDRRLTVTDLLSLIRERDRYGQDSDEYQAAASRLMELAAQVLRAQGRIDSTSYVDAICLDADGDVVLHVVHSSPKADLDPCQARFDETCPRPHVPSDDLPPARRNLD